MTKEFKSGYVTVAGQPNVGKSSLVNALVGETVSIVSAKPQTTRKRTLGIYNETGTCQIVFIDTPGVIPSETGLNPFLRTELDKALEGIDVIVAAMAPWEFKGPEKPWVLATFEKAQVPVLPIVTQCDRLQPHETAEILEKWKVLGQGLWGELIFTSSLKKFGLDDLKKKLIGLLKEGPQYYDSELYTPQTLREIATETVRKHCFELLHQEIPYGLAVVVRSYQATEIDKVEADILVSKESHKGMVIGRGGRMLKEIGTRARMELEKITDKKVFLKLHVVVKPGWIQDKKWLEELGYVSE